MTQRVQHGRLSLVGRKGIQYGGVQQNGIWQAAIHRLLHPMPVSHSEVGRLTSGAGGGRHCQKRNISAGAVPDTFRGIYGAPTTYSGNQLTGGGPEVRNSLLHLLPVRARRETAEPNQLYAVLVCQLFQMHTYCQLLEGAAAHQKYPLKFQ